MWQETTVCDGGMRALTLRKCVGAGKTFCHIEYPVKFEGFETFKHGFFKNWTKRVAREIDLKAKEYWEKNLKDNCNQEECVGEACIEWIN